MTAALVYGILLRRLDVMHWGCDNDTCPTRWRDNVYLF